MSDLTYGQNCPDQQSHQPLVDGDALARFLRRRHHFDTANHVAAETGIAPETVRNWLRHRAKPNSAHFMALAFAYGPDLVAAACPNAPRWLDGACRAAEADRIKGEIDELHKRLEALGA